MTWYLTRIATLSGYGYEDFNLRQNFMIVDAKICQTSNFTWDELDCHLSRSKRVTHDEQLNVKLIMNIIRLV